MSRPGKLSTLRRRNLRPDRSRNRMTLWRNQRGRKATPVTARALWSLTVYRAASPGGRLPALQRLTLSRLCGKSR